MSLEQHAAEGRFPKGTDVFAFKYRGLFYVAPAQDAFMCRLRFAGGIVPSYQLRQVATIAEEFAGGYADVTTRANLQLREIRPENSVLLLNALQDCGIVTRGAGADNIRNITGSPTAGIDPQELIDTRPLTTQLHHYILNHRELYGLPRKFNIAFDGGGQIARAGRYKRHRFCCCTRASGSEPCHLACTSVCNSVGLRDMATSPGILACCLKPEQCVPMAAALCASLSSMATAQIASEHVKVSSG